ncbi:MAG: PEP-CTERM sorting domain-containing protein [Pirellulales bacterium]|nr:PEP-CTERM sorting domain-containing protein [Pirellulales bacterium]
MSDRAAITFCARSNCLKPCRLAMAVGLLIGGLLFGPGSPVQAAIIWSGNVSPSNPATWTSSIDGYIGVSSPGMVSVDGGSSLASSRGYLGYNSSSTGTATVTGAGSKWTNSGYLYVGNSGSGALNVETGGQVSSFSGYLGYNSGSTGTATVTGAGSTWTNSKDLYAGNSGSGVLTIAAGGQVSNANGYLGYNSGSTGTATVTGAGSKWTNSGDFYVGNSGSGTLTVADGGVVATGTLYASLSNLKGNGVISAKGAVLDIDFVFDNTHGLQVTIPFGSGGSINMAVNGTGALGAGYKGTGSLRVAEGITVASSAGYLGYQSSSTGMATVSGTGSRWTNSGNFVVGNSGNGSLTIEAGGEVRNTYTYNSAGYLGYNSGSTGIVTVTGAGSKWTNNSSSPFDGKLYVGYNGSGALKIEASGQVSNSEGYVGYYSGSTGTATITGAGSIWNSGDLYVGYIGSGVLTIEAGGQVSSAIGVLGKNAGSMGTATVTGAGSKWNNNGSLYVGSNGTLIVTDGGAVTAGTLYASLSDLAGNGVITTKGAVLDTDLVFDSTHGTQMILPFGSGGTINMTVDGTRALGAGHKRTGTLRVAEGITVASSGGFLGYQSGSTGTATVTGAGSKWNNSSNLYVGNSGSGALTIEAGGQVSNYTGYLGYNSGSTGTATVTGAGSTWTNRDIIIGSGMLTIEAGGRVSSSSGNIGNATKSTGMVTVTGVSSMWVNIINLYIGFYGSGALTIAAGGQVSNTYGYLGYNSGSTGTATVTGAGSRWTNSLSLYVGFSGSGTLNVRGNGYVTARSVSVNTTSLISLDVGYGSLLSVDGGSATIANSGKVRIVAGPQVAAGSQYAPIAANSWIGSGTYQALGGTWNATSHLFTVSPMISGVAGTPVAVDLVQTQRVAIAESVGPGTAAASFLAKTGAGQTFYLTASTLTSADLAALQGLLTPGQSVLSGWNFSAAGGGYVATDPIYLSLSIPANLERGELSLWRLNGGTWSSFAAGDLTSIDGYASFTITGLSGYAVAAAVPEPSGWALLLASACGVMLGMRRRIG